MFLTNKLYNKSKQQVMSAHVGIQFQAAPSEHELMTGTRF